MAALIYRVSGLCYSYAAQSSALEDLNFSVESGESVAVLGANASGKSTLLHILDGLYFATGGTVEAFGQELTELSVERVPFSTEFRRSVGFLFQNSDAQLFCGTVREELEFGPLQLSLEEAEIGRRVEDILQLIGLQHLANRSPGSLSGGEKKKVALASILTSGPQVILLDEPSAGLDPRSQQWLIEFLKVLNNAGVTLISASHDLDFVSQTSKRVLVLSEDHRLIFDGPTDQAIGDTEMLLSANLIRGKN